MTAMKTETQTTESLSRAIHSAMGNCLGDYGGIEKHSESHPFGRDCLKCEYKDYEHDTVDDYDNNYTVPGQPIEHAKAWAVTRFGADAFGEAVFRFVCTRRDDLPFPEDRSFIADYATIPALDMAKIIAGLIDEGAQ